MPQFLVFFDVAGKPILMPIFVESQTGADAALEFTPQDACYHSIYELEDLKHIGYCDEDIENVIEDIV